MDSLKNKFLSQIIMTSLNQSENQFFPSLPNIKFLMPETIGGQFKIGTLEKDQAEFWENKAQKELKNSIEEYVTSEDKDEYIKRNNIPERHQKILCNDYGVTEYYQPDDTTDFENIAQYYGPILEIGKVIYIYDADSEKKLGSFKITKEMIYSTADDLSGIKYHYRKPIFGSKTQRCNYESESFEIEEQFDISKFTIKTAIWNEYTIIIGIFYDHEQRGWWSTNEKPLDSTLNIG